MTITIILSAIVIVLYWVLIANDDETGNGKEKNIKEDKNVDSSEYLDSNTEKLLNEFDRRKKEQKRKKKKGGRERKN
jgi:hypothetical protein